MFRVLVLMSTYNGSKYLVEQIDSIFHQEGVVCSLLIRDDGSTDNTVGVIFQYMNDHTEYNIKLVQGKNVGVVASFRELTQIAQKNHTSYEYYAFSDQDDIWLPKKLITGLVKINNFPMSTPNAYCSNSTMINERKKPIGNLWKENEAVISKTRILVKNYAQGCTMVFNKVALTMFNKKHLDCKKLHDYQMALICIFYGKLVYDTNSFLLYRQHGKNVIGGLKKQRNCLRILFDLISFQTHHELLCQQILKEFSDISETDKRLVRIVANYKKNIYCRLRLLFNKNIVYYRTWKENMLTGIRIIVGTY